MATTLSHGYVKPANPDTGDTFWGNLSTDIQLVNDHVHDGTTGNILPTVTQAISSSNWTAVSGQPGTYSQTITLPTALSFGSVQIGMQLSNGTQIFPTITKTSSTQYVVYTNDNTQNYTAVYSS